MTDSLSDIIDRRSIIICCGTGGVGKTTIAASLGIAIADRGRSACVVTVDPARRLADALGIEQPSDDPIRIETKNGELYAVMLDAKKTLDELIRTNAASPEQAERIMSNRLYQNLASALSGTQEYMASEKLFQLHESQRFDCIVIDTPPTREALEFLDAPARLTSFIDNRFFRSLVSTSGYTRIFNTATQLVLRTVARIVGSEIVEDTIAFFQAFSGMESGFRERANSVHDLLASDSTSYILVTGPRRDVIEEASSFIARLGARNHSVEALVINRVDPDFGPPIESISTDVDTGAWGEMVQNLSDLSALAGREDLLLSDLLSRIGDAPAIKVPIFETDVHDLETLSRVASHLVENK